MIHTVVCKDYIGYITLSVIMTISKHHPTVIVGSIISCDVDFHSNTTRQGGSEGSTSQRGSEHYTISVDA